MLKRIRLIVAASAAGLALSAATAALAADGDALGGIEPVDTELRLANSPNAELDQALRDHRFDKLSDRYRDLHSEAEKLGVEPKRNALAGEERPKLNVLGERVAALRDDVEKARKADGATGDYALAGGVSLATLEAIAACESGGDPTAVNAAGYYGKYQFDIGTWASVGGSGNPAEAPEAEQDMRASMLYARAGGSPWPVCGQ